MRITTNAWEDRSVASSGRLRRALRRLVRNASMAWVLACGIGLTSQEAQPAEDFFQGKTITISTFASPGGSYDTYSRLLARHIVKFIPGRPNAIVVNQP